MDIDRNTKRDKDEESEETGRRTWRGKRAAKTEANKVIGARGGEYKGRAKRVRNNDETKTRAW